MPEENLGSNTKGKTIEEILLELRKDHGLVPPDNIEQKAKRSMADLQGGLTKIRDLLNGVYVSVLEGFEEEGLPGEGDGSGGGGGGIYQSGTDVLLPPLLEILAEMRGRRNDSRTAANNSLTAAQALAGKLAPQGPGGEFFPGMNPGGVGDLFAGILSGKGKGGHGMFTEAMRKPGKLPIDLSILDRIGAAEPDPSADMSSALAVAQAIFQNAMQIPRFSSMGGGGGSSEEATEEEDLEAMLRGLKF